MKTLSVSILIACTSVFARTATAQLTSRSVCVSLGFKDEREACPGASGVSTAGARGPLCNPGGTSDVVGFEFEIWDKDPDGDPDDYVGTWATNGEGENCVSFVWFEEENPDLFVVMLPQARGTSSSALLTAQQNNGTASSQNWQRYPAASSRNIGTVGIAENCGAGATCRIPDFGTLIPSSDPNAEINGIFAALDSATRPYRVYGTAVNSTATVKVRIDDLNEWPEGRDQCEAGCAWSRTEIRVPFASDRHLSGDLMAHEIGHVLQMSEFYQDYLQVACGEDGWSPTGPEADSCATTEGWASYVMAVAWWDPSVTTAQPRVGGELLEASAPFAASCAANRGLALQVAKAFWDLDDARNESGSGAAAGFDDLKNSTTANILNAWDKFPDGTDNGEDFESDSHGVNMWDFIWNTWNTGGGWGDPDNYETMAWHNCLTNQDLN